MRPFLGIFGLLCLAAISLLEFSACQKDNLLSQPGAALEFSVDTLTFDTVFTGLGNATRRFKIYNPHNRPIAIQDIRLLGGENSDFNLNIDGFEANAVQDIEIKANDSIYIFANVRVDPNNGDMLRYDRIRFLTNEVEQEVILEAYGWNANYIGRRGFLTTFTDTLLTFSPAKPYVLFGQIAIQGNSVLTIEGGTQVFMHGGPTSRPGDRALLFIGENASLKVNVNGSFDNPVEFKTHRLEDDYQELPFQHDGIYLSSRSRDNQIHNAIIRNGVYGIRVDSLSVNSNPKLDLKNTFIYNVEVAGIFALQGEIRADNCVVSNSNTYNLLFMRGGLYQFNHCTLINYGTNPFVGRSEPILSYRDFFAYDDAEGNRIVELANGSARFNNCIIDGSTREEIEVAQFDESTNFTYGFNNCLVKVDTFSTALNNCILNEDPLFVDVEHYNYDLDTLSSPAVNAGFPSSINTDILGRMRDTEPDLGAYEGSF